MATPDPVEAIVGAIERDLNGRKGLHIDDLDGETREQIHATWLGIVREALAPIIANLACCPEHLAELRSILDARSDESIIGAARRVADERDKAHIRAAREVDEQMHLAIAAESERDESQAIACALREALIHGRQRFPICPDCGAASVSADGCHESDCRLKAALAAPPCPHEADAKRLATILGDLRELIAE